MSISSHMVRPQPQWSRRLHTALATAIAALVIASTGSSPVLAAGGAAKAAIEWQSLTDALTTAHAKRRPAILLLTTEEETSFVEEALAGPFANSTLLRKAKRGDVMFARGSSTSELGQRLAAGLSTSVVVTDLEGVPLVRFEAVPKRNQLLDAIKKAEKLCKAKAKLLKQLDKVFEKAEQAMTRQQWRQACLSYDWVIALRNQLVDQRIVKAQDRIDELAKKADEQLSKADDLIGSGEYAQAQKRLVSIRNTFPTPRVEKAVIARQVKIDRELNRYQNR